MFIRKTRKMQTTRGCRDCGEQFKLSSHNQVYCPECSPYFIRNDAAYWRLKAAADASGNPKVWLAKEYGQDFLKSLIPGRI